MEVIEFIIKSPFILLGWLIVGAIAGDIARRLMSERDQGCLSDWLLGVIGAFVGGFLAGVLGIGTPDGGIGLIVANLIIAVLGAVALIALRRMIMPRSKITQ